MKKKNMVIKGMLGMMALMTAMNSTAQINENMGTVSTNGASIASHETANRFAVTNLTYEGTGTIRTSSVSNGYTGASAGLNVQLLASEVFALRTLNASSCTVADSITFGMGKTTNASDGTELKLEYSVDNGVTWINIPFTALPTGTGTSVNQTTPKWYKRSVQLPAGAINANLRLRFRNSSTATNPQFRLDDVTTSCGTPVVCGTSTATIAAAGATTFCAGSGNVDLTATTTVVGPTYQWYNQDGIVTGATSATLSDIVNSGTYYVVVNGAGGCQATSASQYILSVPNPQFCVEEITACVGSNVEVCAKLRTGDLIISQYVEGTGLNKYLEIYNGTCDDVDMVNYDVRTYFNGTCTPATLDLPSYVLAPGATYVIANRGAVDTLIAQFVTPDLQFNGNDAVELYNADLGQTADIFGSICFNPGTAWTSTSNTTVDANLTRGAGVYAGIIVNPTLPGVTGFPTLEDEWVSTPLTPSPTAGLGSHTFGNAIYTFAVSAPSSIISQNDACATFRVGAGVSTVSVTSATFDGPYNCFDGPVVIANVTSEACAPRSMGTAEGMEVSGVNAFPNPFTENTTVTFNNEQAGTVNITLIDMQGKAVAVVANEYMEAGAQRVELMLGGLNPGTYVGHIETANGNQVFRVVKLNK